VVTATPTPTFSCTRAACQSARCLGGGSYTDLRNQIAFAKRWECMTPDPGQVEFLVRPDLTYGLRAPAVATELVGQSMPGRDEETARLWLMVANWLGARPEKSDGR
jgi:hypothetical protein